MTDGVFEMEYPVVEGHKVNDEYPMVEGHKVNDVLEMDYPVVEEHKADDVLGMEYPVVEEHVVEFQEIFEDDQANREDNKDRRLYCKYCGKNFKSHHYVKMHERWHRGELNHHCPECNRAFRFPSELKKHSTIHTGQLPYKCEDCDLRFNKAQAAHQHRLRDHVGMTQDSKQLHQPIIYQMNNNFQPVSFEVVLPNLHTPQQRTDSELGGGHEEFTAECYARPEPEQRSSANVYASSEQPVPRSSVIKQNYVRNMETNYARNMETNYARKLKPNYACTQQHNYGDRLEANYGGKQEFIDAERLEKMQEEGNVGSEKDQFMEDTYDDHFMGNEDVADNSDSHDHIEKSNMKEECKACRKIMEYKNKIAQLESHSCTHK